jgi:hypothetical protein
MMRKLGVLVAVCALLMTTGCAVQQGMVVTRTAHYDGQGQLTGYTVEEVLNLGRVNRPIDRAVPVDYFETGTTADRDEAEWPPKRRPVPYRSSR